MARQVAASQFHQSKTLNDKYLLGDEIGKGAYGRVYKGVDLENGDFVAIKQVSWENIPAEDLASIMQEIDLLKNLNHKNIVKYLGSFKTKTHLYIILEYVENGSLASIIKPNKFGAFPESLVAVYIAQVLEGLVYLHEQGVIHRDIKGANILTTKEGLVKLADFGVATKLTEADVNTHSVVGTPYWMAPEVIDMSGVSAASDIWSVGCTVIELLTCVPPYYDLQPMPALFRIVQDDHPPIPDHVSPAIIDFLHQCFRKDAKLRPDARTLLDHPWIRSRRSLPSSLPNSDGHMGSTKSAEELGNGFVPAENVNGLEAAVVLANGRPHLADNTHVVLRQGNGEVNGVIDNTTRVRVHATRSSHRAQTRDLEPRGAVGLDKFRDTPKDAELDDLIEESSNHGSVESARGLNSWKTPSPSSRCGPEGLAAALKANMAKKFKRDATHLARKEEDELLSRIIDGADDDRADVDSLGYERESEGRDHFAKQALEVTRLIGLLRPDAPEDTLVDACQKLISIMLEAPEQKSHLIQQHGVMPLLEILEVENNRVIYAGLQVLNELVKNNIDFQENACLVGLIPVVMNFTGPEVPNDLRMQAAYFVQQLCHTSKLTLQMFIACRGLPVLVGFLETDYVKYRDMVHIAIDGMCEVFKLQTSTSRNEFCRIFAKSGVCGRLVNTLYTLNESTRLPTAGIGGIVSEKTRRLSHSGPLEKSHPSFAGYKENGKALSGQLDPSRVRFGLEDHHDQSTGMSEYSRQPTAHSTKAVAGQGDHFRPLRGHLQPLRSGQSEHGLAASSGQHHRQSREQSTHDIALRQDDVAKISSATNDVLRAANTADFLPLLSMLETESPSKAHSGQLDRARYYLGLHGKSDSTGSFLQHQLAAKRLSADFESMSVDSEPYNVSISSKGGWVGHSSAKALPVAKNMLSPDVPNGTSEIPIMSEVRSRAISGISAEVARDYISRLADLLLKFCQADSVVKAHVCSGSVLLRLFQLLGKLESPMLVKILKCIKELSMDPCTLEYLQRADAIKQLVPFLERRSGMHAVQIHTQVLNALYNLCKINKRRQEQAAECGIIPHLMHFILTNLPLKQFALPLLCDMAHASRNTREQLRAHKGLEVYLSLLDDEYWAVTALDSLAVCLAHDNEQRKVEQMLLRKEAVQKLVSFFESCNGAAFVHILEPFLKMITKSVHLTTALALSGLTPLLVGRLDHQDAIVRLNLLKLIKAVYEHHPRPKQLVVEYELAQKLQKLIEERRDGERSGGQVLVKQMATTLLKALNQNTLR